MLDLSPQDFDIKLKYAYCLNKLNLGRRVSICFMTIIEGNHVADSFYQLSQLNIDLNEPKPNKAFLFGINYVILTDDTDFREELEKHSKCLI